MSATLALLALSLFGVPAACAEGASGPAAEVTVHGFRDRRGQLRIAIYPATQEDFLAPARYLKRIDTRMTASGEMTVCAPVASAGDYIVVALHDRDANGKLGPFKDGVGFSRNPKLGLSKPRIETVRVHLDRVTSLRIELNYLQGLRPAPWRAPQNR